VCGAAHGRHPARALPEAPAPGPAGGRWAGVAAVRVAGRGRPGAGKGEGGWVDLAEPIIVGQT
jgi:hypothetical protein